jgi:hypothetical protein
MVVGDAPKIGSNSVIVNQAKIGQKASTSIAIGIKKVTFSTSERVKADVLGQLIGTTTGIDMSRTTCSVSTKSIYWSTL